MIAYLAVIRDSFREALASRVLWIVLALITAVLLAIVPLGIERTPSYRLRWNDVLDWRELATRLAQEGRAEDAAPGRHLWLLLEDGTRSKLQELADGTSRSPAQLIVPVTESLNDALQRDDFFDAGAWQGVALSDEAEQLGALDASQRTAGQLARRNRLALESAYPDLLRGAPPSSVRITFLGWEVGADLPVSDAQVERTIELTVAGFVNLFVGTAGVLVAILVTASIIPQMFHAGSIDLLLSKPVSRSLLFLAKFIGGCAFILVSSSYLIFGLWLVVGFRLGFWNHRMLLCVPIFMFLFAIYYCVSALAGLVYRNAVLAVVMTILFWLVCFSLGVTKTVMETFFIRPDRLIHVVAAGDALLAVRETGQVVAWDGSERDWRETFLSPVVGGPMRMMTLGASPRILGPVYDAGHGRIYAAQLRRGPFASSKDGTPLLMGQRDQQWSRVDAAELPRGTVALLGPPDGNLTLIARDGLYRLNTASLEQADHLPLPAAEAFRSSGPSDTLLVQRPAAAAVNPDDGSIALWTGGTLMVLRSAADGQYETAADTPYDDEAAVLVAIGGDTVLVARSDGRVELLDAATLQRRAQFSSPGGSPPRTVAAAPGGRWLAVVYHDDSLWMVDVQEQTLTRARAAGQGNISAIEFTAPNQLLVVDRAERLSRYQLPTWSVEQRLSPSMTMLVRMYRYAIVPLHTCFPKPSQLDETVDYLLSGEETFAMGPDADDLTVSRLKLEPWQPVWSSAIFVVAVLVIACFYVERQEF